MATASGTWRPTVSNEIREKPSKPSIEDYDVESGSPEAKNQRKSHFSFDVDHKRLDINGFVLHSDKHSRQKFRVYLDSNSNGQFDNADLFYGKTGLKVKDSIKGIGAILDPQEVGQVEVKFRRNKLKDSLSAAMDADALISAQLLSIGGGGGSGGTSGSITFSDSNGRIVAVIKSSPLAITNSDTSLSSSFDFKGFSASYIDDPEWQKGWEKHCGENAKPPYPEDCFFNLP